MRIVYHFMDFHYRVCECWILENLYKFSDKQRFQCTQPQHIKSSYVVALNWTVSQFFLLLIFYQSLFSNALLCSLCRAICFRIPKELNLKVYNFTWTFHFINKHHSLSGYLAMIAAIYFPKSFLSKLVSNNVTKWRT